MNNAQFNAYIQAESRVLAERCRQYRLLDEGKFKHGPESSSLTPSEILAVLAEEFGEVSRHVCDAIGRPERLDRAALRGEVVQVAAVAIGWVERLNREIAEQAVPAARPAPAVLMYHDLYTEEELAEKADWQRDPEVGA